MTKTRILATLGVILCTALLYVGRLATSLSQNNLVSGPASEARVISSTGHLVTQTVKEYVRIPCPSSETMKKNSRVSGFKFHIYKIPDKYILGALDDLHKNWPYSACNRRDPKTNYTLLDWRHAHSLFTVDTFIARFLRYHPSHTDDPTEAEIFIIPMMTHLYNCAGSMHYTSEILTYVQTKWDYWKRFDGHDHYIFWWRWGMNYGWTKKFWKHLQSTMPHVNLISYEFLELMGRNDFQDFTLALKPKFAQSMLSIIMPYPDFSPQLRGTPVLPKDVHKPRQHFFYFAGTSTIGGIRRWIKRTCDKNPSHCLYEGFGGSVIDTKRLLVPVEYPLRFMSSTFCGHAAGDALSSRRPTTAVLAGCIPVLICDLCLYAFENVLDYHSFAVFVKEDDVMKGKMFDILRNISEQEIRAKQVRMLEIRRHFVYNTEGPPEAGDALDMLVGQLSLRADLLRSYRRWFMDHVDLSSHEKDYPPIPRAVKKYLQKGLTTGEDTDFNNLGGKVNV